MPKRQSIFIGILVLVYAAARMWRLTESCLWFDEIFSVHAARHAWPELITFVAKDLIHPPLFYLLLKAWIAIGGEGLFWLRSFSLLFAVLSLIPLGYLCREMKLPQTEATIAIGLFAVNGSLIKYAQEVRMYSLLMFFTLLSMWLFSRYYFRGKSFWLLVIANILLVYTHYFGWFVVLSEVAAIAIAQRIKILRTLLMFGLTLTAFIPWIFAVYRYAEPGSTVLQNIGWMPRPLLGSLWAFVNDLIEPFYFQQNSAEPPANLIIVLPLLLLLAAAGIVFLLNFKRSGHKDRVFFLTVFSAVPVLLAFLFSWTLPVSIWGSRHLLIVFPPVLILIAVVIEGLTPKLLRNGLLCCMAILAAFAFAVQLNTVPSGQIWCAWGRLADKWEAAEKDASRPANLYVFEDLAAYHYWFKTRGTEERNIMLIKNIEGIPNDPAYFLPRGFAGVSTVGLNDVQDSEIWISFRRPSENTSDRAGRFEAPVTYFENMGYRVENVQRQDADSQTALLIKMRKVISASSERRP